MNKLKRYLISRVLLIVILFGNILSYATEDTYIECSQECILVNEFHANQCAFVGRKGDIIAEKKCFNIANDLWEKFPNDKYLIILAGFYLEGTGVSKDVKKGLMLYEKVATSNSQTALDAQVVLGSLYEADYEVKKDLNKSEYWYRKAAIKNDADAQCSYAELLKSLGKHKASWYWYKKAAANNMLKKIKINFMRII